jgi:FkbM family methyltransferase
MNPKVFLKRALQISLVAVLAYFAGLLILLAAMGIAYLYPPLFVLGLALKQDTNVCSISESFQGARGLMELRRQSEVLAAECKLLEEDSEGFQLWETPLGNWWIPSGSEESLPILLEQQELNIYGDSDSGVRKDDVVLDCGAHVGLFTKQALSMGARLVVAIEPSPKNLECLRRNLKDSIDQGKVVVVPRGVWDQEDELILHTYDFNTAADSFVIQGEGSKGEIKVPLTTIDNLVQELGLERVDLIKMDIKGAAGRALEGSKRTIARDSPRLVISTEEKEDPPMEIASQIGSLDPTYRLSCGLCAAEDSRVFPLVLFFQ